MQIASIKKNVKDKSCLDARILIINYTDTVASFFEDWNLWGWFNINFKIKTIDTTYTVYKRTRDWTRNFPSYKTLFPGDTLELEYLLSDGACESTQFDKFPFKSKIELISFQVFYKLEKETLESAELTGDVKYRWRYIPNHVKVIIDSLKTPVEINRTFPTIQLQSKEYMLTN